jgi:hypothetical protein
VSAVQPDVAAAEELPPFGRSLLRSWRSAAEFQVVRRLRVRKFSRVHGQSWKGLDHRLVERCERNAFAIR